MTDDKTPKANFPRSRSEANFKTLFSYDNKKTRVVRSFIMGSTSKETLDQDTETEKDLLHAEETQCVPAKPKFETRDMLTNEIVMVSEDILNSGGKTYTLVDVAYKWKKDCRTWKWKNGKDFKKSRTTVEDSLKH